MLDEDELIADVTDVLEELVADANIELATKNGSSALGAELAAALEQEPDLDLEEWLLEREEVVELFIEGEALRKRIGRVLHRLAHGDPPPRWNEALAAAIAADPDDVNARLVFGDWLQQEGDPRGELVAVQAQLSSIVDSTAGLIDTSQREPSPLERRERSLLERFRTHFYGDLPLGSGHRVTWRYGFFEEARVDGQHLDLLLASLSSRFLRCLAVPTGAVQASVLVTSGKVTLPETLRELRLGMPTGAPEPGTVHIDASLGGVVRLESLEVAAEKVILSKIALPNLRRLAVRAVLVELPQPGDLQVPAVTELAIVTNAIERDRLRLLVEDLPPTVKRLRISAGAPGDWLDALLRSPALARLESLDLRGNRLDRDHVTLLREHAPRLAHLAKLDLRGNYFHRADGELDGVCREVLLGNDPDREYEHEYEDGDEEGEYEDPPVWDDPVDIPNEDHFAGEEEDDEPDEDIDDERQERGVDEGPPIEDSEKVDDDVVE